MLILCSIMLPAFSPSPFALRMEGDCVTIFNICEFYSNLLRANVTWNSTIQYFIGRQIRIRKMILQCL